MLPDLVLDRFVEHCPAGVMTRAVLENLLSPERLNQIFEDAAQRQYSRELLFSELVAVMSAVVTRTHRSVNSAYQEAQHKLGVSPAAVYDKLNRLEPGICTALIRETAADAAAVIDAMPNARLSILPNREVFFLDGNHLAASEHRLAVTRITREGPLPGQTLALLDAQRGLIVDLEPCEDGHAQERSLLPALQKRLPSNSVIVADRNFCTTKFLSELETRKIHFAIRQHGSTLSWKLLGEACESGPCETGTVSEQQFEMISTSKEPISLRRITVTLNTPTEKGDQQIHILSSLPADEVSAIEIAETYRQRWTIEGVFQKLTDILRCEIETLGYPKAALFAFATAVLASNVYAVVKAALRSAHGVRVVEEQVSDYHFVTHVTLTHTGMSIAVVDASWNRYRELAIAELASELVRLAKRVDLKRYPKASRGPKKPRPARKSGSRNHHVSTARLLKEQKQQKSKKKTP